MSTMGLRIKTMRMSRGMSRADLAKAVGASVSAVSMWENDSRRPKHEMLEALADAFNVPIFAIMHDEDELDTDDEIWELRELIRRNPNMRALFSTAKNAKPEHIKAAAVMLEALKSNDGSFE